MNVHAEFRAYGKDIFNFDVIRCIFNLNIRKWFVENEEPPTGKYYSISTWLNWIIDVISFLSKFQCNWYLFNVSLIKNKYLLVSVIVGVYIDSFLTHSNDQNFHNNMKQNTKKNERIKWKKKKPTQYW